MQIPYAGSDYAIYAERARQATETCLPFNSVYEIQVLEALRSNNCSSAPAIREHQFTKQDDDGLVPGGFMHWFLMEKAPGIQLSRDLFWSFGREERDHIRAAFKEAWGEWMQAGACPQLGISHVFWDPEPCKVSVLSLSVPLSCVTSVATNTTILGYFSMIAGSNLSTPLEADVEWKDSEWEFFGLVEIKVPGYKWVW
ncbi:hypothetical protein BDW59DRAFT_166074 [Aspergillus cavernicola]|uniref:Uncharacterized protein n=1 Tax=Aspergillus cavernicola TaxID=176166 RepID=A0ABR4HNH7_9EURO